MAAAGSAVSLRTRYALLSERLYFLSVLLMLWNLGRILLTRLPDDWRGGIFLAAAWGVYAFAYCLPLYLVLLAAGAVLGGRASAPVGRSRVRTSLYGAVAIAAMCFTQALVYADSWVHAIFGSHLNGFVLNLLLTPGGIASMDMSGRSALGFIVRLLVLALVQAAMLVVAMRSNRLGVFQSRLLRGRKRRLGLSALMLLLAVGQALGYGLARATWYSPVLEAAEAVPFYVPVSFNHLARAWGWQTREGYVSLAGGGPSSLQCPTHPLRALPNSPRYNVMVLMCETLRADMLTPEIMPGTSAFAGRAVRFNDHYSSGNNTREGVFGAMTGLHGTYWQSMLRQGRGCALVRFLQDSGYDIELFTSQSFTYPEFDRTVFASVSGARMHVRPDGPTWQRDRGNVDDMIRWLSTRDRGSPFMTFMFFESSHARYAFPPESVIRSDYAESLDYASDLRDPSPGQARQVFNRYINSVHHLDSQLGRLIEYLDQSGQMEDTIVVVTGDHGEAFYERGWWGHGGDLFLEEQVRVPLILHVPGLGPATVDDLTSHVDIVPTVMARLGVANPAEDYSVGRDLLQPAVGPPCVVSCGWDSIALITDRLKYVCSYKGFRLPSASSREDQPLNEDRVRDQLGPQLLKVMAQMRLFQSR